MTAHEPEFANRWATEHYGFEDDAANQDGRAVNAAASSTPSATRPHAPRSRRRTTFIASAILSVAMVAGIGGTAVASDDGPKGGHDGITHVDRAGDRGGRGGDR
jgi:hypothetical protein